MFPFNIKLIRMMFLDNYLIRYIWPGSHQTSRTYRLFLAEYYALLPARNTDMMIPYWTSEDNSMPLRPLQYFAGDLPSILTVLQKLDLRSQRRTRGSLILYKKNRTHSRRFSPTACSPTQPSLLSCSSSSSPSVPPTRLTSKLEYP